MEYKDLRVPLTVKSNYDFIKESDLLVKNGSTSRMILSKSDKKSKGTPFTLSWKV